MDTISPPEASLRACVHAMKHRGSSSGSKRDKTRRKVSCPGMPCGKASRSANHSAWALPYSSMSSQPSAAPSAASLPGIRTTDSPSAGPDDCCCCDVGFLLQDMAMLSHKRCSFYLSLDYGGRLDEPTFKGTQ